MNSESMYEHYGPWALIAGGSEGIGLAFAHLLATQGINLILLGRTEETLTEAAKELRSASAVEVQTHALDLTAEDLGLRLDEITSDLEIGMLIYNAGAAHGAELFHDASLADALHLVNLNCRGPVVLTHAIGGKMRDRGRGGIILMSSMSGLSGGAYIAAYTASKSFDITLAEALWAELSPLGVDVLGLIAGATDTPAMGRAGVALGQSAMQSREVALEGLAALGGGPVHVAGEGNRAFAGMLRSAERQQPIEMMSQGAAGMFGKPYPHGEFSID